MWLQQQQLLLQTGLRREARNQRPPIRGRRRRRRRRRNSTKLPRSTPRKRKFHGRVTSCRRSTSCWRPPPSPCPSSTWPGQPASCPSTPFGIVEIQQTQQKYIEIH